MKEKKQSKRSEGEETVRGVKEKKQSKRSDGGDRE